MLDLATYNKKVNSVLTDVRNCGRLAKMSGQIKKLTRSEIDRGEWYNASAFRPSYTVHVIVTNQEYKRYNPAWYEPTDDTFADDLGFDIEPTHWMLPKEV